MKFFGKRTNSFCLILILVLALNILIGCNIDKTQDNPVRNSEETDDTKESKYDEETISDKSSLTDNEVCYIKWAVPNEKGLTVKDEWIEEINTKLKADGYDFGLQLVRIDIDYNDLMGYQEKLDSCGADIVFTGYETISDNFSEKAITDGKLMNIEDLLKGSRLYNIYPENVWDSVSYNGNVYMLPSEITQAGLMLFLLSDNSVSDSVKSIYKGSILDLDRIVSSNNKFYFGFIDFSFVICLGYYYDFTRGAVFSREGRAINPFENQDIIGWLRLVNRWYKEGAAVGLPYSFIESGCKMTLDIKRNIDENKYTSVDAWDIALCKKFKSSTAIKNDSLNKEKAFKLLEIIRTNHEYGNLLIYGVTDEPEDEKLGKQRVNHEIFGLDDGLICLSHDDLYIHFNSSEERLKYYEEYVKPSPTLQIDLPVECNELAEIINQYMLTENILFSDSFDEKLEQFKTEYTEAFDRILKDYK